MGWLGGIGAIILTGVLAGAVAVPVGSKYVTWYRVSQEGGFYTVALFVLAGLVLGWVAGAAAAAIVGAGTLAGFAKTLSLSCGSVLVLAGSVLFAEWAVADIPPTLDGHRIDLLVELRLPAGDPDPRHYSPSTSYITFSSNDPKTHAERKSQKGVLGLTQARQDNGRWILTGLVTVFTKKGMRTADVILDDKPRAVFLLPLPPVPGHQFDEWSDWLPRRQKDGSPWPASEFSYRFRVKASAN